MAPIQTPQAAPQPQQAQFAAPPARKRRGCFGCLGRALIGSILLLAMLTALSLMLRHAPGPELKQG
jgi:hypothetical protein